MRSMLAAVVVVASLFGLAVAAPACGRGSTCSDKCACEGCSAFDLDHCLAGEDNELRDSDFRGCLPYYDELRACEDATGACFGPHFETSCHFEHDRWKGCMDPGKH